MAFSSSSSHSLLSLPHLKKSLLSNKSSSSPKPSSLSIVRCSSSSSSSSSYSFDLQTYWTGLLVQINAHLDSAVPVRHPPSIYAAMRHSLLSPHAKRAPPVMCLAVCDLFGVPQAAAFPTAAALEMVHSASLVHDDLPSFDSAHVRRGLPSAHSLFGVDIAVLAGDALFPLAFQHIVSSSPDDLVPPNVILSVVGEISRAVGATGMAAGQFLDLNLDCCGSGDGDAANVVKDVITIVEKKFGEMAECSAVCGGLLGSADEEELNSLRRYGRAVGVLYQLVDDILMEEQGRNGNSEKMRSNVSIVKAVGMGRAIEMVEELRKAAKGELKGFEDKYGVEKVMPLYSFVDYAVERGFAVEAAQVAAAA